LDDVLPAPVSTAPSALRADSLLRDPDAAVRQNASAFAQDDTKEAYLAFTEQAGRPTVVDQYGDPRQQTLNKTNTLEGVARQATLGRERPVNPHPSGWITMKRKLAPYKDLIAELLGTWMLLLLGDGVVANVVLSKGQDLTIYFGWGFAVLMGIFTAGGYSGAHLNPAVTLSLAVWRGFPWKKVGPYMAAQFIGAFLGAATVYLLYYPGILAVGPLAIPPAANATAGIFSTYPNPNLSTFGQFVSEVIGTAILLFVIFATGDTKNSAPTTWGPLAVALLVFSIGASLGWGTGYAINPARDFGPRYVCESSG